MKNILAVILIFLLYTNALPQSNSSKSGTGSVSGSVFDNNSKLPIEYSNIVIFSSKDSLQITGTISDKTGKFKINNITFGKYYVSVQFVGFEKKIIKDVNISSSKKNIELGKLYLKPSTINLQSVEVTGNRSPVTYQIDKKVIDPSQLQTSISGTAADVLENVPSITVDIDGNVSLRGSTSFTVLIDGRPSVLDAQDALQQIPASSIETIEIITNPSAKYDPEGNAGIINIKLKKNQNFGLSGIANANAGMNSRYGGDFLFQYKTEAMNYNFGMDYNNRMSPGSTKQEKRFILGNNTSYVNSNGSAERSGTSFGLRGGLDFNLSTADYLSLGGRFGTRDHQHNSNLFYDQWSTDNPLHSAYLSQDASKRSGSFYALYSNYNHKFNENGHELSGEFYVRHRNSDENSTTTELQNNIQTGGKQSTESGPSTRYSGKLDYTLPFNENRKFEAGSEGRLELSEDQNGYYEFNNLTNSYDFKPDFSNDVNYNLRQLSIYSIYADAIGDLGIQGGIRTEYTYRNIDITAKNQEFSIDRWDFFPSFHTSYKFKNGAQIMASYTRRIDRPHGWQFEPFYTWIDANNIRKGNPDLIPEFIDSYELGFQTFFGNMSLSNEFYYRVNHNRIEDVTSIYSENVTLRTPQNVGIDYSLGYEFMLTVDPFKFWDINLSGNLYDYKIKGKLFDVAFSRESFNWSARMSNGINFTPTTQLQLNIRYNSPSVSSQGSWHGYFMTDLAVKQDFLNKKFSVTLQIRDLLQTGKFQFTQEGPDFYNFRQYTRQSPTVMLNFRFNFNNYKNDKIDSNNSDQPDNGFSGGGEGQE